MTLRYNQVFPPRCARCDYYSQNYYFLSDKFVAIKQFDDTISLRFDEHAAFQQAARRRRAEKWWSELLKHMKQLKLAANLAGTEFSLEMVDKNKCEPLKLARFPQGYAAPPLKRKSDKRGVRQQYTLSITLLDIDHPARKMFVLVTISRAFSASNDSLLCVSGVSSRRADRSRRVSRP